MTTIDRTADIELQTGSEFMVSACYGLTPRGDEFIDAWQPDPVTAITVVDSGFIIIPDACLDGFASNAKDARLKIVKTQATV